MKLNLVPTFIAVAISSLISYGFYTFHNYENKILLLSGCFIFLVLTLTLSIGMEFELPRTTINVRSVSFIFFALAFICNLIFTFINFSVPIYIILNGLLMLIFFLIVYSISKAKQ